MKFTYNSPNHGQVTTNISENHPDVKGKSIDQLKEKEILTGGTDEDYSRLHTALNPPKETIAEAAKEAQPVDSELAGELVKEPTARAKK
jgi:hypothetical protein